MPWLDRVTQLDVDESSPGGGASGDWITLNPNEVVHYTVKRTDATPTEFWAIDVITSLNSSLEDDPPFERYLLTATQLVKSFLLAGVYSFRVKISNAAASPSESVETDHYYRKDGVNL